MAPNQRSSVVWIRQSSTLHIHKRGFGFSPPPQSPPPPHMIRVITQLYIIKIMSVEKIGSWVNSQYPSTSCLPPFAPLISLWSTLSAVYSSVLSFLPPFFFSFHFFIIQRMKITTWLYTSSVFMLSVHKLFILTNQGSAHGRLARYKGRRKSTVRWW